MRWLLPRPVAGPFAVALLGLAAAACDAAGRSEMLAVEELTEPISAPAPESGAAPPPAAGGGALEEMDAGVLGFFTPILAGPGTDTYSTRCDPYDDDAFTCL